MKFCIVGPGRKYFGGVTAYTICLANAIAKSNQTSVLAIRNILPRFLYPGVKNVGRQDHSLDYAPGIHLFNGMDWNNPVSWFKAYGFLKKEKPEAIVMAWWTSAVAHMELFLSLANSISLKYKMILELHEIVDPLEARKLGFRLYSRMIGRWIMNRSAAFVVHSEAVKDLAVEVYKLKPERVFVVPHGVYNAYVQDYTRDTARQTLGVKEEFTVLYFGMIRKYKGIPCLVEAFNLLPEEIALNTRLIIAGENWGDEERLEETIKSSRYARQITFIGEFIPDKEVAKYFTAADVVALPYQRSAGSGVASLAMAFGKPVIISDLENIKEFLSEYEGTRFVPQGDAGSIAEWIIQFYKQHQAGQDKVYQVPGSCGWNNVTEQFQQIVTSIDTLNKQNGK